MRKFFLIVCMLCMYVSTVHAQTNIYTGANQDFNASIYGDINVDMMYSYGSDSNYANKAMLFSNGYHSFGSQSFLEDSYFGVNLSYKNLSMLFELGFSDYIRKYVVKYDFKDKYGQFISVGRDETLAFYEMGQTLNSYQGLTGFGALNADNRRLQVRYGIENFEVALIFPFLSDDYEQANDNAFFARNFNNAFLGFSAIPRLEAAYHYIYNDILSLKETPSALVVTKNAVPVLATSSRVDVAKGAYTILPEKNQLHGILIATGSEVHTAINVAEQLYREQKLDLRVVSMPCMERFLEQSQEYQEFILPTGVRKIVIEAGSSFGWHRFVYNDKYLITVDQFGASGSKDEVLKYCQFDFHKIKQRVLQILK